MRGLFTEVKAIVAESLAKRGMVRTLKYALLRGPVYAKQVVQQLRQPPTPVSDFDARFGVDTDGAHADATHLRDLEIASPNWIQGSDYIPIGPERFRAALSELDVAFDGFAFVDFGCGKGRAILLASDYPFRELVGIDFSNELVATAQRNWSIYDSGEQRCCAARFVCADFVDYQVPRGPAVLFFYNPCSATILSQVAANVARDVAKNGDPVAIVYVNALYPTLWENAGFRQLAASREHGYTLYANDAWLAARTSS